MHKLTPFAPAPGLEVHADIRFTRPSVFCRFTLRGSCEDAPVPGQWTGWERADELWRTTCFEAFFASRGEPGYWELNLSPARHLWNLYHFDGYRQPQPPRESQSLELREVKVTRQTLECRLENTASLSVSEFALCAVVRTAAGPVHFALKHQAAKADFHDRANWLICDS